MRRIEFEKGELSILLMLLKFMKSYTKQALINQFGKEQGKAQFNHYKALISELSQAAGKADEQSANVVVELNGENVKMLQMFLTGYLQQMGTETDNAQVLMNVREKVS
ncbi:hypothetical protein [Alkalibacillus haloalkaliphilus]|uniref:hypothetical protein n=1 Tax=Alkalibacillus haloalkaliphilus TaxID=94136 RepID=UPI00030012ED|nr:hypothetical protein [Alkalibacillus haloalkaliphilus]